MGLVGVAYAFLKMHMPLGKCIRPLGLGLGFGFELVGLSKPFSQAHYLKLNCVDKIVSASKLGILDFGRYKMGCQVGTKWDVYNPQKMKVWNGTSCVPKLPHSGRPEDAWQLDHNTDTPFLQGHSQENNIAGSGVEV